MISGWERQSRARGRRQGWGGRAEAAQVCPTPGTRGLRRSGQQCGPLPSPRLSNGPLEGCVVLGISVDGTPPPASKVEHVTVYKTPEEKLRTQPDAPLGVGKKLRGI